MCTNSGNPRLQFFPLDELLRRVDFLRAQGFKQVMLTGGEPTIHSSFEPVIRTLFDTGISWHLNTHGRKFRSSEFTKSTQSQGLQKVIVSLHSHEVVQSCEISGQPERGHYETVEGIKNLLEAGIDVTINCVITRLNMGSLPVYLDYCHTVFGLGIKIKFVFPSSSGKGRRWPGSKIRFDEVRQELRTLWRIANQRNATIQFESVPLCVLGDMGIRNIGRSGFGETHYLEDTYGKSILSMEFLESVYGVFPASCKDCTAIDYCSGVQLSYLEQHGNSELVPFVPN